MRDPYIILGVSPKASPDQVKVAFRNLAKQYHPDVAGDSAVIATTFQEINTAYGILGDPVKRTKFDHGEIDESGAPKRKHARTGSAASHNRNKRPSERSPRKHGEHKSASDAWAARARAGNDRNKNKHTEEDFKTYSWSQKSAADGPDPQQPTHKSGQPHRQKKSRADEVISDLFQNLKGKTEGPTPDDVRPDEPAQSCDAAPASEPAPAPETASENWSEKRTEPSLDAKPQEEASANAAPSEAPDRETTREAPPQPEPVSRRTSEDTLYNLSISFEQAARGTSRRVKLPSGKRLDVRIPAGVRTGQQIRLKGQGQSNGAQPGDALIEIQVEPHSQYTSEGEDVYLTLPVSIDEAVLGAKIMVPTLDGPVAMTVPPDSNADTTLRLKGRGLPRSKPGDQPSFGDQYVSLKVILPPVGDKDFLDLVQSWAEKNAYDVRSDFSL